MRARWLVLLVAACGGRGSTAIPRERPALQLVRCAPATPPPAATDTVPSRGASASTGARGRVAWTASAKPVVTFGTASSDGPLIGPEIVAVARTKQAELLACFADVRSLTRIAVVYRFQVNSDGTVGNLQLTSDALGGATDACVRRSLRALKFAAKGAPSAVSLPIMWSSTGGVAPEPTPLEPEVWTPFALDDRAPAMAPGAARATEAAVRPRLTAIDACFKGPAPTGSLRLLLDLDTSGELSGIRAGGLGDKDAEWCAARALAGLRVLTPIQEHVEIACDLARGDAAPWKISLAAGYEVIEAEAKQLRHGTETVRPGVTDIEALPAATVVVVARPETLGGMLQLALIWAREASAVLFAVGDGKSPPVFVGMGHASSEVEVSEALRPALRVGKALTTGCVGRTTHEAKPGELAGLMQKLVERCRTVRCAPTMVVAVDGDATARDLLEVSGAARRAGFDRLLFGGPELGCTSPTKTSDPVDLPDYLE